MRLNLRRSVIILLFACSGILFLTHCTRENKEIQSFEVNSPECDSVGRSALSFILIMLMPSLVKGNKSKFHISPASRAPQCKVPLLCFFVSSVYGWKVRFSGGTDHKPHFDLGIGKGGRFICKVWVGWATELRIIDFALRSNPRLEPACRNYPGIIKEILVDMQVPIGGRKRL